MKDEKMKAERGKRNIYIKIMYMKALLVPYTLGSIIAYQMFREATRKLLKVTFCHFFEIFLIYREMNGL
jgi:uncharacterized membrane protein YsdA (DUF1294 family)